MFKRPAQLFRIEANYAGVQGSFWVANLLYSGFTALLLSSKGFSNTQIGLTSSVTAIASILFQLSVSSFSDTRQSVPIKKIMAILLIVAMACAGIFMAVPLPFLLMMLIFSIGAALQNTYICLMNAQFMQYTNAGIPVNYGWPRGTGSIIYAVSAFFLGSLIEKYSPFILMPLFLLVAFLSVVAVLLMPNVSSLSNTTPPPFAHEKGSRRIGYLDILKSNRVLVLFLLSGIMLNIGQSPAILFLIRVVQQAGGSSKELGISMFLQSGIEMPVMILSPLLLKRFPAHRILAFANICYAIKMLLLALSSTIPMVYAAMGFSLLCFGLYGVSSVVFVNSIVKGGEKVRAQGLMSLSGSLGGIIGNYMAGLLIDQYGLKAMMHVSWVITALSALIMLACARLQDQHEKSEISPLAG